MKKSNCPPTAALRPAACPRDPDNHRSVSLDLEDRPPGVEEGVVMKKNQFVGRDIISVTQFDREDIDAILSAASACKKQTPSTVLAGKIIANCFFESSTRTRLSFEAAAYRSGASVLGFDSAESLSIQKGESLRDTVRVVSEYADLLVMRHPLEGSARLAADVVDIPVINAGDGANQHPTQALTDIFTMHECHGKLDGLTVGLVGDLKHARTIHSLVMLCSLYDIRLWLVSPESLTLPESFCDRLKKRGVRFSFHRQSEEIIPHIDILYMTRVQRERIGSDTMAEIPQLTPALLKKAKPFLKILHPLPRLDELPPEIDALPFAHYFQQAKNGLFVRQALLNMILGAST